MTKKTNKQQDLFINRNFKIIVYLLCLAMELLVLFQGSEVGLFGIPFDGMDQKTILVAAYDIYTGNLPQNTGMMSPIYILWVALLFVFTGGNIFFMRLIQAILCALIPVMIYKLAIRVRLGVKFAQLAAVIHCFYGPAILISLDFLRAAPLGLCFILMTYFLYKGFGSRKIWRYLAAGLFAAFCVLGRENFIPIVLAPMFLLVFAFIRHRVNWKYVSAYVIGIMLIVTPLITYNFVKFNSLQIIPGHTKNIADCYHGDSGRNISALAVSSLKKIPDQSFKFISSYEIPNSLSFYAHNDILGILKVCIIPFNLLVIMSLIGLVLNYRNRAVLIVGLAAFAYFCTMIYFEMFYRFRIPVEPLLCLLAAAGLKGLFALKGVTPKVTILGIICILFFMTYQDPMKMRPESEKRTVTKIFIKQGLLSKAEEMVSHLDQSAPETVNLKNIIALEYSKLKSE